MNTKEQLIRAKEQLAKCLQAEEEALLSQSYSVPTRSFTKANLREIGERIEYWKNEVTKLENSLSRSGRNRCYRAIPRDL